MRPPDGMRAVDGGHDEDGGRDEHGRLRTGRGQRPTHAPLGRRAASSHAVALHGRVWEERPRGIFYFYVNGSCGLNTTKVCGGCLYAGMVGIRSESGESGFYGSLAHV